MPANEIPQPKSFSELQTLTKPLRHKKIEHNQNLSVFDKVGKWITDHVGTMGFFMIIFVWTVLWLGWNTLAPQSVRFDPYPGFVLWLFISNMIQIFLMPLIMIGQNLQSNLSDARAEADFDVNCKAEMEIENILLHLENQNALILKILEHLEQKADNK